MTYSDRKDFSEVFANNSLPSIGRDEVSIPGITTCASEVPIYVKKHSYYNQHQCKNSSAAICLLKIPWSLVRLHLQFNLNFEKKSTAICILQQIVNRAFFFFFFLVGYVEERPWWPIQSPNKGRKKNASS